MPVRSLFNEHDKGSNLLGIATWSVLGKQNQQAKMVYLDGEIKVEMRRGSYIESYPWRMSCFQGPSLIIS